MFDGKKCSLESDGATYTMRIRNVDFSDAGDVECQARNRYGAVSIRAKLTVLGKLFYFVSFPVFVLLCVIKKRNLKMIRNADLEV